jgi:antitoxin HicB
MANPHIGSSLRSFYEELGEWDETEALALKKIVAETLRREMAKKRISKSVMAKRMDTSRSQLDAILDGNDPGLTVVSLSRASFALGMRPKFVLVPLGK